MKTAKLFSILILLCFLCFFSCRQQPAYTVTGTVADTGLEGKKVFLMRGGWSSGQKPQIDSAVISGGRFIFRGDTEEPDYAHISVQTGDRNDPVRSFVVLENTDITFDIDADRQTKVSGTVYNDEFQKFLEAKKVPEQKWQTAAMELRYGRNARSLTPEQEQNLSDSADKYRKETETLVLNFIKAHIDNPGAWTELHNCAVFLSVEQQKELIAGVNGRTARRHEIVEIRERVATLEKTAVGQLFTDLKMSDPDGKSSSLSDYAGKGKYVLIDFWASWCGPCRSEMPNVLTAYAKYKDKGFEIIGVSFDGKHESWVKAIRELNLPWPQMSDLKGWESAGAKVYGVTGIPHTILLDKEGKIIARNLHGEELNRTLAELLK